VQNQQFQFCIIVIAYMFDHVHFAFYTCFGSSVLCLIRAELKIFPGFLPDRKSEVHMRNATVGVSITVNGCGFATFANTVEFGHLLFLMIVSFRMCNSKLRFPVPSVQRKRLLHTSMLIKVCLNNFNSV
jgi:hypothetical protein